MTKDTLKRWLNRHKDQFPATYVLVAQRQRRIRLRVISPADVYLIRRMTWKGPGLGRWLEPAEDGHPKTGTWIA